MLSTEIIFKIILIIAVFAVTLVIALYSTYGERKVAAVLQDRHGPNRSGPFGIFQPFADGVKMFTKEELLRFPIERLRILDVPKDVDEKTLQEVVSLKMKQQVNSSKVQTLTSKNTS